MSTGVSTAPRWIPLLAGVALLATACAQTPRAPTTGADTTAPAARGSRVSTPAPGATPRAADVPALAKLDGMIIEWDEAQSSGEVDRANTIEQSLRYEVEQNHATLEDAARGNQGLAARYLAVSALGFSSRPQSTLYLVEVLRSNDARLVGNALIALKLRADPETPLGPVLYHIEKRADVGPRRYAPLALARILEARLQAGRASEGGTAATAVGRLSALVDDVDPVVRLHVARALGVIRTPATVEPLRRLVADDHARVQWAAAAALAETGDLRGFPSVLQLLNDTPAESKHLIRDILVSYANRLQAQPLTPGQLAQLGTGARAWSQWFTRLKRSRGIQPGSLEDASLGG